MRERKTFVRKTASFEQTTQLYEKRSRDVLGSFCFSLSREGPEQPFGSREIVKENHI